MNTPHFLLQHYYIYDKYGRKVVDHVLKLENLASEFNQLMAVYNMNLTMDEVSKVNPSKFEPLGTNDLDDETISLINEVYYHDFVYFNYSLVQPSTNEQKIGELTKKVIPSQEKNEIEGLFVSAMLM
jgi:hypothetical protein